jgi:hypothetical protein
LHNGGLHSIQLSTLFLIISRLQVILLPSLSVSRHRYYIQYASLLAFFTSYVVIFVIVFQRGYWPPKIDDSGEFLFVGKCLSQNFFCIFYQFLKLILQLVWRSPAG